MIYEHLLSVIHVLEDRMDLVRVARSDQQWVDTGRDHTQVVDS
jgi:hypothetical protein